MRIIFMGTPDFAVPSLETLLQKGNHIVAVITAPDKPKGRGQLHGISPVKACAESHGLPVLQPANLKDEGFLQDLRGYEADLQVVVAFRMLPEVVWAMPKLGTFNLHASLLPQYRGAAPINWAIINGEKQTGVTTFFLKHEIDTGHIIMQEKVEIDGDENAGSLYQKLMYIGADLVVKTVKKIETNNVQPIPQVVHDPLKPAPKIFREDCEIDWSREAREVRNFVRGLSPYPGAWTKLHDKQLKIYEVQLSDAQADKPGLLEKSGTLLLGNCTDRKVVITDLQLQGKKRMSTPEFLNGYSWRND